MVAIDPQLHDSKKAAINQLHIDREPWERYWEELATAYIPQRYSDLYDTSSTRVENKRSTSIKDSTGTMAAKTLAFGLLDGITSPSRPWHRQSIPSQLNREPHDLRQWLDERERIVYRVLGQSNFYQAMATHYLDLAIFGTSVVLIYEDAESVMRCYNPPLGQYYLAQSDRGSINTFARRFSFSIQQIVERWGLENCSQEIRSLYERGGASLFDRRDIVHLIEPNENPSNVIAPRFQYREFYWEEGANQGEVLGVRGFNELPGLFTRWETIADEAYGTSPGMDALPDVLQLQQETIVQARARALMVEPPLLADAQLRNQPSLFKPASITYVNGLLTGAARGAMPAFETRVSLAEMTQSIQQTQGRIQTVFHNDLFRMISQLQTVRSATEIDARREEKLVLLGPVLERIENESLDPALARVIGIAERAGLLPPPPGSYSGEPIDTEYLSILSVAQRAASTAPVERFMGVVGNLAGVAPEVLQVVDWVQMIYDYGIDIGVPAVALQSIEEARRTIEENQARERQAQDAEVASELAAGAQTLSRAQVGGGLAAQL